MAWPVSERFRRNTSERFAAATAWTRSADGRRRSGIRGNRMRLRQFGRFQIIRKLGRSMTDVYLALDPETTCYVVLKVIEQSRDEFTQLVIEAERRGAQLQKQLHEIDRRILEVYDFGEQQGCFFVSMEYFEGKSIAEILQAEGRLDPPRAARFAMEVCSQLSA